ncbi:MAG: hypothetical protein ACK4PR_01400 [Gammaproteobacteria bacterium]
MTKHDESQKLTKPKKPHDEKDEPMNDLDEVGEAGEESFPASDPPPWTLGEKNNGR